MLALLLCSACAVLGAGPVILDDKTKEVILTPYLSLFRDSGGRMDLEEVREVWANDGFNRVTGQRPTLGFTEDAVWLRFEVLHVGMTPRELILELMTPRMDDVKVFLIRTSGRIEHFEAGNARGEQPRSLGSVDPAFPLLLQPREVAECFVRVRSETSLQLPLRLAGVGSLSPVGPGKQVLVAGLFGYLISLILLGFLFGQIVREPGYYLYALALCGAMGIYLILSGYWVWLGFKGGPFVAKQGLIIAGEFAMTMKVLFLRRVLDLDHKLAGVKRWFGLTILSIFLLAVVLVVAPYRFAYPVFVGHLLALGLGMMLLAAFSSWGGDRVAIIYFVAWIVFWLCCGFSSWCFLMSRPMDYLPWVYSLIGSSVSATLFLVAIADRVRQIRQRALVAHERLVALEQQASKDLRLQARREQLLIRDLHDGIGGLTANLAILAELGRRDASAELEHDRFARITEMATHGGAEVRSLMGLLETREMFWTDFFDECRSHAQIVLTAHGIGFNLEENSAIDDPGPGLFPGLSLLRVVKESMANAVKHAACSQVLIRADFSPDQMRLTVRDNGCGFAEERREGRGLRNMAARVRELDGTMSCRSKEGVELEFRLPLPLKLLDTIPGNEC